MTSPAIERASKSTRTEAEYMATRCPVCNGKGYVRHWVFLCKTCNHTGKKERSA